MPPLSVPLAAIRQPAFLYDAGGRVAEANDLAEALAGKPLAGLTAADVAGIFHARTPDGVPIAPAELPAARALAEEEVVDVSLAVTAADGRTVEVRAAASPVRDGGAIIGALVVWRELSGEVESEERLGALVTASSELLYRMSPDWSEMLQLQSRGFLANTERPIPDWLGEYIPPDERPRVTTAIHDAIRRKGVFELEHQVWQADGSRGWTLSRAVPLIGADGEIAEWFGAASDVTARREAEAALREANALLLTEIAERTRAAAALQESEAQLAVAEAVTDKRQRLLDVLEALPVAVCLLTPDHGIAFANRYFRETLGAGAGRPCYESCFGLSEPCPFCESFRVLETGEPHRWEVTLPNGRIMEANNLPFTDVDGTPMVLEMDRDVSEERHLEAALREANARLEERVRERTAELEDANARLQAGIAERTRAEEVLREYAENLQRSNEDLQRFAYVASHDLQEPLRSVVSFSQLLERRYRGQLGEDADEYIEFIVEGGNRMQGLILDLLAFSRVNTTRQQIARTDVEDVLAEAVRTLDIPLREADATLTHDRLPVVMADPVQLLQVFSNLISNAVKFRKPDVPLLIHVGDRRADGFWEFSVSDNGIGIEPEYFDKIFVIFQRLHTKETYPGTGIGLAIVKRIIDRHGGTIRVESTSGEGSTFFFTLPAA